MFVQIIRILTPHWNGKWCCVFTLVYKLYESYEEFQENRVTNFTFCCLHANKQDVYFVYNLIKKTILQ